MDKQKIIWTVGAVAMTGIFIYSFFHEHHGTYCQICCSDGFAWVAGFVLARTYFLYQNEN